MYYVCCSPVAVVLVVADGVLPSGVAPVDMFIISRLNDSSSYFFTWFCKRYRMRVGVRDLGGKEEIQRCPICLDPCTKSIELQCGHAFCRSCLTTSAANNITSCALCRREQVINPEILRARFDEQRMLNLARRLAIPPPVRSRASTSGTTMSNGGSREGKDRQSNCSSTQHVGDEEKEVQGGSGAVAPRPLNVESMTTRGQMLFGPWGDVGAMSTDDLRRRWEFSGMETSSAPYAVTVGAASAAELRSSWRNLQHLSHAFTYMRSEREVSETPRQVSRDTQARADASSCSGEAELHGNDKGPGECDFQVATPDSPCAGGSSLGELSSRWRTLARASLGKCSTVNDASDDISIGRRSSSMNKASVDRKCTTEPQFVPDQVSANVSPAPFEDSPVFDDDVGSLAADCLKSRWLNACKQGERDVGATEVKALADRFCLVRSAQGVGGVSNSDLTSRWTAARSKETVGATEVGALEARLSLASGAQSVGDRSNADLSSRWTAPRSNETVGATEATRLALASGARGVGDLSNSNLSSRWTATRSKETVGATDLRALASRLSLARGAQGVGAMSNAGLSSRWNAAQPEETVGATAGGTLSARLSVARGAQGVGAICRTDLTNRWIAAHSNETVGETEATTLTTRLSLARGEQGVGDLCRADLANRWTTAPSTETVGETETIALANRLSLAGGAQGVGDISSADLTSRWTAARLKEADLEHAEHCCVRVEEQGSSSHVGECQKLATHIPGWCMVDGMAITSGEVGKTCTLGKQAAGAVSSSVIGKWWRAAGNGGAPLG